MTPYWDKLGYEHITFLVCVGGGKGMGNFEEQGKESARGENITIDAYLKPPSDPAALAVCQVELSERF